MIDIEYLVVMVIGRWWLDEVEEGSRGGDNNNDMMMKVMIVDAMVSVTEIRL